MEVYKFNKCLLDRLEESMLVLPWKEEVITASQVRNQWSCFIEIQIEPAGWQAIWNIPRVICEALNLRYPTAVFGHVEQVLFKELRAVFVVEAVQDDDINFLERHEVALEELWPTIVQENSALNVERTADCLDSLRFFYTHVWMPWDKDNDDDINWVEKHLESRIRFCYDLRKGCIKRTLAQHIRTLLTEAKYIQQRREYLELGLSDDEEEGENTLETSHVNDLMHLHLRLSMIRNEIEILENPEMRGIYEQINFNNNDTNTSNDSNQANDCVSKRPRPEFSERCFIVMQPNLLQRQIDLLSKVKMQIDANCMAHMTPQLVNALQNSKMGDKIFLTPGKHYLKFLEYLNEKGLMSGINVEKNLQNALYVITNNQAIICSPDDDSMLLVFNGDYTLENLVLDCHNVRTGILIKSGTVTLRNCRLIGNGKSSTQEGIMCAGKGTTLKLDNCTVEKFANGIILQKDTEVFLNNTKIINCKIGVELNGQCVKVQLNNTYISKAEKCGIYMEYKEIMNNNSKYINLKSFDDLLKLASFCSGNCEFEECRVNINVMNQKQAIVATKSLTSMLDYDKNEWHECDSKNLNNEKVS